MREFQAHEVFLRRGPNQDAQGANGHPDVLGYDKPMVNDGHIQLSDQPALGIELNEDLIRRTFLVGGEEGWE